MAVALVATTVFFIVFEPVQVLRRIRLSPGYALTDDAGSIRTSDAARGQVTLYSFLPIDCDDLCADLETTLGEISQQVEEVDLGRFDLELVTIALADGPSEASLADARSRTGRVWLGGDWNELRTLVGAGFRHYIDSDAGEVTYDPALTLVDPNGVVRAEFRFDSAFDADRVSSSIRLLSGELRGGSGVSGMLYDAAHIFSCYG